MHPVLLVNPHVPYPEHAKAAKEDSLAVTSADMHVLEDNAVAAPLAYARPLVVVDHVP
jgi:hypothetical protein